MREVREPAALIVDMYACMINFYSTSSAKDRNIPPDIAIRAFFHLSSVEMSSLFPMSLRHGLSKLSKQTVSRDCGDYSNRSRNFHFEGNLEFIETYRMKLCDVMEACSDFLEPMANDREVIFYSNREVIEKLQRDGSPLVGDDDCIVVGHGSRIFDERDLWIAMGQERLRSFAYYYQKVQKMEYICIVWYNVWQGKQKRE